MPRSSTTAIYTRVDNSFSNPVAATTISPTHAGTFFDDVQNAMNAWIGTSTTSQAITTGAVTLTVASNVSTKAFLVGMSVRAFSLSNAANYMDATVTSYNTSTGDIVLNVFSNGGSGTIIDWVIISAGARGAVGPAATIAAGSTTTGQPGTAATVSNSGSSGAATFNFTIPAGLPAGYSYAFATSVTMADPTAGNVRLNNATVASATAAAISVNTAETGNPSIAAAIAQWDASNTTAHRGILIVRKITAPSTFAAFDITGASVNNTTWYQLALTYLTGNGTFSAADAVSVHWTRTGDTGGITNGIAHAVALTSAASVISSVATIGTAGRILVDQGAAADPGFKVVSGDATLSSAGALTVTKTSGVTLTTNATAAVGQLPGTTTNDSASAGNIGEVISATTLVGSAVSLSTGTAANVASISLTAGDWDVAAMPRFTGGGTTTVTYVEASISTTTGTRDTTDGRINQTFFNGQTPLATISPTVPIPSTRLSLSGTTTVFLVAVASFGTSTCSAFGTIRARRMR